MESRVTDQEYLNREHLMALKALASKSIPDACSRYSVGADFAMAVAGMSVDELNALVVDDRLLFAPVVNTDQLRKAAACDPKAKNLLMRLCPSVKTGQH